MIPQARIDQIKRDHGLCPDQDLVAMRIARQQDELRERRRWVARNRDRIDAEWNALKAPPLTIEQHFGKPSPERQAAIQREWDQYPISKAGGE